MKKKNYLESYLSFTAVILFLTLLVTGCSKEGTTTRDLNGNFSTTFQFMPLEFTPDGEVATANTPIEGTGSFQGMGNAEVSINQLIDFTVVPTSMTGNSKFIFNGSDEIWTEFNASSSFPDAQQNITYTGIHTITGGKGIYSNATGLADLTGTANLISSTGSFTLTGEIEY